jgi:hypothetical protein
MYSSHVDGFKNEAMKSLENKYITEKLCVCIYFQWTGKRVKRRTF